MRSHPLRRRDNPAMTFFEAWRQMMESGGPSRGDDLLGMAYDFTVYFSRCPGLATVGVTQTADPDALLEVSCVAVRTARPSDVAEQLVDTWLRFLRYGYRAAHQVVVSSRSVILDVITQIGEGDFYVTGTVTVRWL